MSALEYLLGLPDVEVDVKDKKGGGTALYLAAKKANRYIWREFQMANRSQHLVPSAD